MMKLGGVLAVLSLAACAAAEPADEPGRDEVAAAVSRAWAGHLEAARTKDRGNLLALYADDVVYEIRSGEGTPGSGEVRGLESLREIELASLEQADVLPGVVHVTLALELAGESAAYELGTVVGPVRPRGEAERVVTFRFMALWQRGPDGAWRIRHLVGRM